MTTNSYRLAKPTEKDLIAFLQKLVGDQTTKHIMSEANDHCGYDNPGDPLLALTKIVMWLSRQKGMASVAGQSMAIRIKFYNSIYKNEAYAQN